MHNLVHTRRILALTAFCGTLALAPVSFAQPTTSARRGMTADVAPSLRGKPDPQMKAVLDSLKSLHPLPIAKLKPKEARLQPGAPDAVKHLLIKQGRSTKPEPVASVSDVKVPGPPGASDVTVRLYKPLNAPSGPLPVIVYFHGGGFVIASVAAYDSSYRGMANKTGAIVAAVAYRYAPEHRLPAAHEDSYAATQYFLSNAERHGGDSSKVAVMGESAGASLATDMCIMAKMRGGKMPIHQTLVYPFVNDKILASHRAYYNAKPLDTPGVKWFLKYAPPLSKATKKKIAPLLTPLYAPNSLIEGLPSATVIGAELDPLQSEGQLYTIKLRQNGVRTSYRLFKGVTHEFFGMSAVLDKAKVAQAHAANELKAAFAR